jgi:predicted NAD/FAD-binding protein
MKKKLGIIGGGVAGITAAFYLQDKYEVTLFEKEEKVGGHTNTIPVKTGSDKDLAIDTGFIVLNDKNYPNLHALLKDLDVPVRFSNMSFSFYSHNDGFCYSGDTLYSLFADRRNIFKPSFYMFLNEIRRFSDKALIDLDSGISEKVSMYEYLQKYSYSDNLINKYLLPMGSAIWSTTAVDMLKFPAKALLAFFKNHGLLSLKDRPKWQTVCGGSDTYVKKFRESFKGRILSGEPVEEVILKDSKHYIKTKLSNYSFDIVISALHANLINKVFLNCRDITKDTFASWEYNLNHTVLHTDNRVMPLNRHAWASWNYIESDKCYSQKLFTSYYMNLLMGIDSPVDYFVTLNSPIEIAPEKKIYEVLYEHPLYTTESLATQNIIQDFNGSDNIWFCGSYLGNGFHEDAVSSALAVVRRLL